MRDESSFSISTADGFFSIYVPARPTNTQRQLAIASLGSIFETAYRSGFHVGQKHVEQKLINTLVTQHQISAKEINEITSLVDGNAANPDDILNLSAVNFFARLPEDMSESDRQLATAELVSILRYKYRIGIWSGQKYVENKLIGLIGRRSTISASELTGIVLVIQNSEVPAPISF